MTWPYAFAVGAAFLAVIAILEWREGKRTAFRFVWRHWHLTYANYPAMGHGFLQVGPCFWTWSYKP